MIFLPVELRWEVSGANEVNNIDMQVAEKLIDESGPRFHHSKSLWTVPIQSHPINQMFWWNYV